MKRLISRIKNWSALIRLGNVLITAVTQWLLYAHLIKKTFTLLRVDSTFQDSHMIELISITALILAGGNIFNDVKDVEADSINRPSRSIIGQQIPSRAALHVYRSCNIIAIILSIHLAMGTQAWGILAIALASMFLLHLYSAKWQHRPWLGNTCVAVLCSLAILIVAVGNLEDLWGLRNLYPEVFIRTLSYFVAFALFAFLSSLIREISKDMQDLKGDNYIGAQTLALTWEQRHIKMLTGSLFLLILLTLLLLHLAFDKYLVRQGMLYLLSLGISTILIMIAVIRADTGIQWKNIASWMKLYILQGILFLLFWQTT